MVEGPDRLAFQKPSPNRSRTTAPSSEVELAWPGGWRRWLWFSPFAIGLGMGLAEEQQGRERWAMPLGWARPHEPSLPSDPDGLAPAANSGCQRAYVSLDGHPLGWAMARPRRQPALPVSVARPGDSVLRTLVVRAESIGSARPSLAAVGGRDSDRTGGARDSFPAPRRPIHPAPTGATATMLTRRSTSAFDLFDRLEHQLSQQLQTAERVPAAEVHDTPDAYRVVLELPGVDKAAIEVKATERTLLISAERRHPQPQDRPKAEVEAAASEAPAQTASARAPQPAPLLSEFRYGTWSRSFRFPVAIEREQLQAVYRDGLLTVTAPKAKTVSTVTVTVQG